MKAFLTLPGIGLLAAVALAAAPVPPGATKTIPSELPRGWNPEEITKEVPPFGAAGGCIHWRGGSRKMTAHCGWSRS